MVVSSYLDGSTKKIPQLRGDAALTRVPASRACAVGSSIAIGNYRYKRDSQNPRVLRFISHRARGGARAAATGAVVARADAMRISNVTKQRMVDVAIVSVAWSAILF